MADIKRYHLEIHDLEDKLKAYVSSAKKLVAQGESMVAAADTCCATSGLIETQERINLQPMKDTIDGFKGARVRCCAFMCRHDTHVDARQSVASACAVTLPLWMRSSSECKARQPLCFVRALTCGGSSGYRFVVLRCWPLRTHLTPVAAKSHQRARQGRRPLREGLHGPIVVRARMLMCRVAGAQQGREAGAEERPQGGCCAWRGGARTRELQADPRQHAARVAVVEVKRGQSFAVRSPLRVVCVRVRLRSG